MLRARPERGIVSQATPAPRALVRRIPRRALLAAAGAAALLVIVAVAAFGPLVRARVAKEAGRRKLDVVVGAVRPGFFAVTLRDVDVRPEGVEGVRAKLDEIRIDLTAGLSLREVTAHGGELRLDGEPEDLADRLRSFRRGGGGGEAADASARRTPFAIDGVSLAWKLPSGGEISGAGLSASRDERGLHFKCVECSATARHVTAKASGAEIDLAPDGSLRRASARAVDVAHEPPKAAPPSASPAAESAEPVPPPLPSVTRGRGAKPKEPPAAKAPVDTGPVLPLPDLHAARAKIATLATAFGARLPDGAAVEVAGLSAKLELGGEAVAFGPGAFNLTRRGDRVHVSFATDKDRGGETAAQQSTPLSVDAELPLGSGDVVARLSGGPVSLAALGVKEGTKGLSDVGRGAVSGKGQLVLSSAGDALTFDGEIALRSISIKQPRLSPDPLRGLEFAVSARGVLDDAGRLRVDDAQLEMGALRVRTHGTLEETKEHFGLSLAIDVAPAACQALLDSAPRGLLPTVSAARMTGTFGAQARVVFDTRAIDKLVLDYQIDDRCRVVEVSPDLSRDRFAGAFTYRTYHPDGTVGETQTGPGTSSWTNIDDISPFMIAAVLTTEDGAFYRHHGFNHAAIRSSVQANLKARRFVRGASTITMQLAKNLFLSRQKTLSRKIEEVILTDYLEQIFRKDDMMELYLNVVEFGPDVYGITHAADHYFGRKPEELNVAECFFLATLLPSPLRYGKLRDRGEVPEHWMRHLQALMEIAAKNGKISRAELADGQSQEIVFHRAGDPRPEPRKPATGARRGADEDDAAWQPLD